MHKKKFHASLDYLYEMLDFVHAFASKQGFEPETSSKIKLATEEALVNIIHYGFSEERGEIEICCDQPNERPGLKILIKDQGIPFDPIQELPKIKKKHKVKKRLNIEDHFLGGYGILIYIGVMDQVKYLRTEEGNILYLIKYL